MAGSILNSLFASSFSWNQYVQENLLERLFGFELLMAPYAIAHLKLCLQLQDLGYQFTNK